MDQARSQKGGSACKLMMTWQGVHHSTVALVMLTWKAPRRKALSPATPPAVTRRRAKLAKPANARLSHPPLTSRYVCRVGRVFQRASQHPLLLQNTKPSVEEDQSMQLDFLEEEEAMRLGESQAGGQGDEIDFEAEFEAELAMQDEGLF